MRIVRCFYLIFLIIVSGCYRNSTSNMIPIQTATESQMSKTVISPLITTGATKVEPIESIASKTPSPTGRTSPALTLSATPYSPTNRYEEAQELDRIPTCSVDTRSVSEISSVFPGSLIYQDSSLQSFYLMSGNQVVDIQPPLGNAGKVLLLGWLMDEERLVYSTTGLYDGSNLLEKSPVVGIIPLSGDSGTNETFVEMTVFEPYVSLYSAHTINGWRSSDLRSFENQLLPMEIGLASETTTSHHLELVYGLLDPIVGEWENHHLLDLPGYEPNQYVAYSPDFTNALYVEAALNRLVLWDMQQRKILWERMREEHTPGDSRDFQWSTNGARAAFRVNLESLSTILSTGEENHLRELVTPDGSRRFLMDYQLSPTGEMVSLVYRYYDQSTDAETYEIFVYDFHDQSYIYRCSMVQNIGTKLYWSPDSRFLASGMRNIELITEATPLTIYDTQEGTYIDIVTDGITVGWLKKSFDLSTVELSAVSQPESFEVITTEGVECHVDLAMSDQED